CASLLNPSNDHW
nr:immunoglobulin heavy chain junction region [Macaca mulatta]